MKGNFALAEGALRAGCRMFAGYPITPQTEILEYLSVHMEEYGGQFVQTESELQRRQKPVPDLPDTVSPVHRPACLLRDPDTSAAHRKTDFAALPVQPVPADMDFRLCSV